MPKTPHTAPLTWPDAVDEVLGGDLTAAVAYLTPAGGAVVTAIAPLGLRDRERGTLTFTTSLGFGRKLERLARDPHVALAYHAREHGFSDRPEYVLVQGRATVTLDPDREWLERTLTPTAARFLGAPRRGPFWDRWLREYYTDRVAVEVAVDRIVVWPDLLCHGQRLVIGADHPPAPVSQAEPRKGAGPRVDPQRAGARLRAQPHRVLAFRGGDGYPEIVPVAIGPAESRSGIVLRAAPGLVPPGGRRAGILAHNYRPQLIGLNSRQHTGWLSVDDDGGRVTYAPHTAASFDAPPNKTLLLLANGFMAKRNLRRTRRAATSAPA